VCDKTSIFFFFPIINKYFLMAKRSLLSRCPSYYKKIAGKSNSIKYKSTPQLMKDRTCLSWLWFAQ